MKLLSSELQADIWKRLTGVGPHATFHLVNPLSEISSVSDRQEMQDAIYEWWSTNQPFQSAS